MLPGGIEPALGRSLLAPLGDDARGVGFVAQRDLQHLLGRGHFKVQGQVDLGHQPVDIAIGNVAAVFAEVRGDAVGAGLGSDDGRAHRIGMVAAARVPDGRDMIDIDAQPERIGAEARGQAAARLPGLIAGTAASSGGSASAS